MTIPSKKTLLLCRCDDSQTFDDAALQAISGAEQAIVVNQLCGQDMSVAVEHLGATNELVIACAQQAPLFERLADEISEEVGRVAPLGTIDLRDRAGWSSPDANPTRIHAKQAALLAAAQLPEALAPLKTIQSDGICCIVGPTADALRMAELVKEDLGVTCVFTDGGPIQKASAEYDMATGKLVEARGALGAFELTFENLKTLTPSGRGALTFSEAQPSATSDCDIFIDVRGGEPAFPAHEKRNGYFWADPALSGAFERIALTARERVGEFEKTVYFKLTESLCAHSQAKQSGCSRCLDVCPTEAIFSAGDHVAINSDICAGCGSCAAVCPTSAVTMTETPFESLTQTLSTLAEVYQAHAGEQPRLLLHTQEAGGETITQHARLNDGLADDLIPLGLPHLDRIGHAELLAALGAGFTEIKLLADDANLAEDLNGQLELAQAMVHGAGKEAERISLITPAELAKPATFSQRVSDPVLMVGGRRDLTRVTVGAMAGDIDAPIPLPTGAPYGALDINSDACTLCLACVSLCPTGALGDHPDRPEIQFTENACVQCGICESTCPENAIDLVPQLELSKTALEPRALHGEEPFECISCGVPFGVASTINRIVEKLENKHWMFTNSDNVQLVKMCDDCRVKAQYHGDQAPMAMGERPKVRTSDDYFKNDKKLDS